MIPLHHHQEQKPLRAQTETWYQHLCSNMDLQTPNIMNTVLDECKSLNWNNKLICNLKIKVTYRQRCRYRQSLVGQWGGDINRIGLSCIISVLYTHFYMYVSVYIHKHIFGVNWFILAGFDHF